MSEPATWTLQVDESEVAAGGTLTARVELILAPGWHVNSCRPNSPQTIPTVVTPVPGGAFTLAAPPAESEPHLVFDPALGQQVAQHAGTATFHLAVRVSEDAAPGPQQLVIRASAQLCDDTTCLPPAATTLTAEVTVTPRRTAP
jgi:hypothetical protein